MAQNLLNNELVARRVREVFRMRIDGTYRMGLTGCLVAMIVALIFTSSVSLISGGSVGDVSEQQGSVNLAEDSRGGDDGGDDENSPTSFA